MSGGTCSTCKHWNPDPHRHTAPINWRACGLAADLSYPKEGDDLSAGFGTTDFEGYGSDFLTAATFGCNCWEPMP